MRCQLCLNISWHPLCKNCLSTILTPTPSKRVLENGLIVYSFYKYSEISNLLHTKHTYHGAKIFSLLSKHAVLPFIKSFTCKDIFSLPIDDHIRSGYSHSAIITKELSKYLRPLYSKLRAKNRTRYSGQKLDVRKKEKRDFTLTCKDNINVILIDDIVTSGNTLIEANEICEKSNVNVLFAIVLADANEDK
ncbi:ComF family protein [Sulfurospirillum arcachonense]|uniref:ComF family protein n=1 Tax=Sulfurospirillum arcachonense TaxID=57666 RepID=UPI00046A1848|nr:ComF family protein [Sulfurospirillum arcachonense]